MLLYAIDFPTQNQIQTDPETFNRPARFYMAWLSSEHR